MFDFERIKYWWWYTQRRNYLDNCGLEATNQLHYFDSVHRHDIMSQDLGLKDMHVTSLPHVNVKKMM